MSVTPAVQLTELEPAPTDMRGVPAAVVGQWRVWQSRESEEAAIEQLLSMVEHRKHCCTLGCQWCSRLNSALQALNVAWCHMSAGRRRATRERVLALEERLKNA